MGLSLTRVRPTREHSGSRLAADSVLAFIRGGTELATAYTDTLGDEILGLSRAALAGLAVAVGASRRSGRAE